MGAIVKNGMTGQYEFETDTLSGSIRTNTNYHGITGLMHKRYMMNAVRPEKAFLNVEYYTTKEYGRLFIPRNLSSNNLCTVDINDDTLCLNFPKEDKYCFELTSNYTSKNNFVHHQCKINPHKNVKKLSIFIASYICQGFDTTVVFGNDGDAKIVDNRKSPNFLYYAFCDEKYKKDRLNQFLVNRNIGKYKNMQYTYEEELQKLPVFAAMNSQNGMTLLFIIDNRYFYNIATQYHGWDTAHDWEFIMDLHKGREVVLDARLVYLQVRDFPDLEDAVEREWKQFQQFTG